jgi:hypothetical protein
VFQSASGFGDVAKAADVFDRIEMQSLLSRFLEINEQVGQEVVRFNPWMPMSTGEPPHRRPK